MASNGKITLEAQESVDAHNDILFKTKAQTPNAVSNHSITEVFDKSQSIQVEDLAHSYSCNGDDEDYYYVSQQGDPNTQQANVPKKFYDPWQISILGISMFLIYLLMFIFYVGVRIYYLPSMGRSKWIAGLSLSTEILLALNFLWYCIFLVRRPKNFTFKPQDTTICDYHVHVLIPCYKESKEIVTQTCMSAIEAPIPSNCRKTVYLCDDGNDRDKKVWVKQLLRQTDHDITYVSDRKKPLSQVNGKSLNLNNVLQNVIYDKTQSYKDIPMTDLICIFDADQCAHEEFFKVLVPLFDRGQDLSVVISPQSFYNTDRWSDIFNYATVQFWEHILPAMDCANCIFCTGTNLIIRAHALAQAGWFPYDTVTEDFELGVDLTRLGWKGKYVHQFISTGEAPEGVRNIFQQRSRWTKGAFQVLLKSNSALTNGRLTVIQYLHYYYGFYSYVVIFVCIPIIMSVPILAVLLRVFPFVLNKATVWVLFGIVFLARLISLFTRYPKQIPLMMCSSLGYTLMTWVYFKACFNVWLAKFSNKDISFKATSKQGEQDTKRTITTTHGRDSSTPSIKAKFSQNKTAQKKANQINPSQNKKSQNNPSQNQKSQNNPSQNQRSSTQSQGSYPYQSMDTHPAPTQLQQPRQTSRQSITNSQGGQGQRPSSVIYTLNELQNGNDQKHQDEKVGIADDDELHTFPIYNDTQSTRRNLLGPQMETSNIIGGPEFSKGNTGSRISFSKEQAQKIIKKVKDISYKFGDIWPYILFLTASMLCVAYVVTIHFVYKAYEEGSKRVPHKIISYIPHFEKIDVYDGMGLIWVIIDVLPIILLFLYMVSYNKMWLRAWTIVALILSNVGQIAFFYLAIDVTYRPNFWNISDNYLPVQLGSTQKQYRLQKFVPPPPGEGTLLGVVFPYNNATNNYESLTQQVGFKHAILQDFFEMPQVVATKDEALHLQNFMQICVSNKIVCVLTLETHQGLRSYTTAQVRQLAVKLYTYGTPVLLRFDQEMNGYWYPWSFQPSLYVQKFQEMHDIMQQFAPNVYMTWAPNIGQSYPLFGVNDSSLLTMLPKIDDPATAHFFQEMDTNHNGQLDEEDDAYLPYYPGDQYVSYVATSTYSFGLYNDSGKYQNGYNIDPTIGLFNYTLRDLYTRFAERKQKQLVITETSSLWIDNNPRGLKNYTEFDIKSSWIKEVYGNLSMEWPYIMGILWFNQRKAENAVKGTCPKQYQVNGSCSNADYYTVDWTLQHNNQVLQYYVGISSQNYFLKGDNLTQYVFDAL